MPNIPKNTFLKFKLTLKRIKYKVTNMITAILNLVIEAQVKINKMKVQEEQITDYSVVSNVDIIGELEKLKRAKQTNEA